MFVSTLLTLLSASLATAAPILKSSYSVRVANPSSATVTNSAAYNDNANVNDGIGAGTDSYTYYSGPASSFPNKSKWLSFDDMFNGYMGQLQESCGNNGWGPNNTPAQIQDIKNAIQSVGEASLVDHRFIFAVIMQESVGCVWVPTTDNGVTNPGLMQSHSGATFDSTSAASQASSITQMVQDGTQGTAAGDGLVQGINQSGNVYKAARIYNSGSIAADGNLSNGNGATACYVSDIANRLTGWVNAPSACTA
ncbi:MAG: hypothetical protein M4579_005631 [Chaenotheca gracillima]|nr:MAG: hypothetical protein M4579_005631 [Chaenotheca gracillima]